MPSSANFIHLRVHSEYSVLEGAVRLAQLPELCKNGGFPAVALTDTNNMFALLEFSETMAKSGIQPIVGFQANLLNDAREAGVNKGPQAAPLVLLAQSQDGLQNLKRLTSLIYLAEGRAEQGLSLQDLQRHSEGVICLTGGPEGAVGRLASLSKAKPAMELLTSLKSVYPDRLYVEIQRHPGPEGPRTQAELKTEPFLVEAAYELDLPLVATNDVYFPERDMFESHDVLTCIAEGTYLEQRESRRQVTPEHFFKSQEDMIALFEDLPEAIENTVEIARRCAVRAKTHEPILPKFADDEVLELERQAREGLEERLRSIQPAAERGVYEKRLEFELDIIKKMGFPGYFLIVADIIKWAKSNGIPVGPGRGSGAGSLVAYVLTITDLDPIRYSLLFERFLNPERVSMPDFDIDFCMDGREEVISYVKSKYSDDRVAQITTFGALLSKAAVRDVGRVLQMPYPQVDGLAKLIPSQGVKPMPVLDAIEEEPRLKEASSDPVVKTMLEHASKIEGLLRNVSTHAAGVVIADRPLQELVPLYKDPRSEMPATQYTMKWVEAAGLVKFDFLGLKTLTIIQKAVEILDGMGIKVNIDQIPLDDKKTYDLYTSAKTVAVFQVESSGMMDALRRMKPTCIEDIVALVALYRPGPMENIPKYCEVKNGLAKKESIHPQIDGLLEETQGIIVYQEQVMQIAQEMAGYSLGQADLLRRAMGKKIKAEMDKERPRFVEGAKARGIPERKAGEVWELLEKFANYGFNKSHAAAYAVVSYQTAWLKANHPVAFMAAAMNCELHLTDKLSLYRQEIQRLKINLVPPGLNTSDILFKVEGDKLHYGLGALKSISSEALELIMRARGSEPFNDLFDFARRADLRQVGKRAMETLTRAGVFDEIQPNRRSIFESIDQLIAYSASNHDEINQGQSSLFGSAGIEVPLPSLADAEDWEQAEKLSEEHKALGFYLSGHPLEDYMELLKAKRVINYETLEATAKSGSRERLCGIITAKQERKSAKGNRYAFVTLSDPTGIYEMTVFSELLEASREHLEVGQKIAVDVSVEIDEDQLKLLANNVCPVDDMIDEAMQQGIEVFISQDIAIQPLMDLLRNPKNAAAQKGKGEIRLCLAAHDMGGEIVLELPEKYPVGPRIRSAIKSLPGVETVKELQ